MKYVESVQQLIGDTPLFKLRHELIPNSVHVFAKLEMYNPGGSIKDRLGSHLIKRAIQDKKISTKGTIIEPTAGNTGIGLAIAARGTAINVICVVPEKFSVEKQKLMKALGAKVIVTPTSEGMEGAVKVAKELEATISDSYCPQQFSNFHNPLAYYESLGPEVMKQMNGQIDVFIAGGGTSGTFMGMSRFLKEKNHSIRTVIVEPVGSILNGGKSGPHKTEGIGMDALPPFFDWELVDEVYTINDQLAFDRVRDLALNQGLLVGSSSGAAFQAAIYEAQKAKIGSNILTIFPDSSERYMSKDIYEEEL